jgi:uncharacterized protein YggT (Ycf19 family)
MRRVHSAAALRSLPESHGGIAALPRGAPQGYSKEYRLVLRKLRDMQLEIGQLQRRLHEAEQERSRPVAFSRFSALASTLVVASITLVSKSVRAFRARARVTGVTGRLLVPKSLSSQVSHQTPTRSSRARQRISLTARAAPLQKTVFAFLYHATLIGVRSSVPFLLALLFLRSGRGWKRNVGFFLSSLYSLYLIFVERFLPGLNSLSIATNLLFLLARHYYLNGLLSCGWASHLH